MNDSSSTRSKAAGTRVPADWQPRHIGGSIDDISWKGWTEDPARPLADLALAHLRNCRDRSLAKKSAKGYDAVEASFLRFVEREAAADGGASAATPTAVVGDLATETIYAYLKRTSARGGTVTIGAQRSEGGALKAMTRFGIEIGAVRPDALRGFRLPKPESDAVPTTLSDADIRRLDARLRRVTNIEGCRLHLWYWLELDTGARPAEQAGIWLADIDTEEHSIRIRGKGAKNRIVYFGDGTAAILQRYLRVRGESKHPELFLGRRGPMGAETFSKLFREVADELSLAGAGRADGDGEEAATLYILRRTFARLFAENGGTVEELARLMGHEPSSIPMLLKLYYRPSDERLRRAHRRVRPVDALFDGEGA